MKNFNEFDKEVEENIIRLSKIDGMSETTMNWMLKVGLGGKYTYNFKWMGRPIIQFPQDMIAIQELIWKIKPDLIIETGIAHGGSLMLSASMLALLDMCDAIESGVTFDPKKSKRKVLALDIDIREHNRIAIESHPMSSRIQMIQGSSIDPDVIAQVNNVAKGYQRVLVCLDSNHTHEHVLAELQAYAPLTSIESYCIVMDTLVEDMPEEVFHDRPWGPGDNPKTAVWEYLKTHPEFEIDKSIDHKLLISVVPDGYLKRIK
jgi:cephalosporin hydroxylase